MAKTRSGGIRDQYQYLTRNAEDNRQPDGGYARNQGNKVAAWTESSWIEVTMIGRNPLDRPSQPQAGFTDTPKNSVTVGAKSTWPIPASDSPWTAASPDMIKGMRLHTGISSP